METPLESSPLPPPLPFRTVATQAEISPRILDHWVRRGYVSPDERCWTRSGYPRTFGPDEAEIIAMMARLVRAGFRPEVACALARRPEREIEIGPGLCLVVDNE